MSAYKCDVSNNSQFLISLQPITIFEFGGIALHTAMVIRQKLDVKRCGRGPHHFSDVGQA